MNKMRILRNCILALAVIGSVSLAISPAAQAATEAEIAYNEAKARGVNLPWVNASQFQTDMVGPCYQAVKNKTGSWASRTTEGDCARIAISCVEYVTTQSRCTEPDSMADAAQGKNAVQRGECGAGLGADNGCFVKWNQEAREDRWNKEYDSLITNLCSEAAKAGTINPTQAQSCHGDGEAVFNECYDKIAKTDPRVPADQLRDCFNQGFKNKNGIDAADPATPGNTGPSDPANGGGASSAQKSVCAIQKIGWLVCPVTEFISWLADKVYGGVAGFMEVRAFSASQDAFATDSPLMKSWVQMRDIANILFVAAFLAIIYSQITGAGVSNYGIKRMLPRLIAGAILVNASFYICALAVDLSNILGYALKEMLTSMRPKDIMIDGDKINDFAMWTNVTTAILAGGAIAGGAIVIGTAAGGLLATALGALIPLLLASIFAVIVAFLILLARQAIIIVLIVISPLAFVAYLLPNTESLFDKWRKIFTTLLVMFPLMSLLFGGSQLAAYIIQQAGVTTAGGTDAQAKIIGIFLWIGGLAVLFIPLFITPLLIKFSGGVLGKLAGVVNNKNKGILDRGNKFAEDKLENMRMRHSAQALRGEGRGMGVRGWGARRAKRNSNYKDMLKSGQEAAEAGFEFSDETARAHRAQTNLNKTAVSAANMAQNRALTGALADGTAVPGTALGAGAYDEHVIEAINAQTTKATAEAIKDVELSAQIPPGDIDRLEHAFRDAEHSGDTVAARAFQNMLLSTNSGRERFHQIMSGTPGGPAGLENTMGAGMRDSLRQNILSNHGSLKDKDKSLGDWAGGDGRTRQLDNISGDARTWANLSAEEFVQLSKGAQHRAAPHLSTETRDNLKLEQYKGKIDRGVAATHGL